MAGKSAGQFDRLVAPHLERLFRVACRLHGNVADAQDLVQDTCVTACENLDALAVAPHPLRWLLRTQYNRFIDGTRRRRRAPVVAMDVGSRAAHLPSLEPGPDDLLQQEDGERALDRAFHALDPVQRTLLSLRAEGYDLAEIEAVTGVARDVLRMRLYRARRSLAQQLEQQAGVPTRASLAGSGT